MSCSRRACFLLLLIVCLASAMLFAQQPAASPQVRTAKADCDDYGAGGRCETDTDTTGGVLVGRVYDPHGTLREKDTDEYVTVDGAKQKKERHRLEFNEQGLLTVGADFTYNPHGGLTSFDLAHYGVHGEATWEQTTNYQADDVEIKEWIAATHNWTTQLKPYKKPRTPIPALPQTTSVGVLFPRDFHPGQNITGTLALAGYAENFKGIPGLSEASFAILLDRLPDGTPQWPALEIGVKGDGYIPVDSNGMFTLHIPMDWTGPLDLEARQSDPLTGVGSSPSILHIGSPVAAPALPKNLVSPAAHNWLQDMYTEDLVNLWSEAFDLENEIDEHYESHDFPINDDIGEIEGHLNEVYEDIDELTAHLPTEVVVKLARHMANNTRVTNAFLRTLKPNDEQEKELLEWDRWASFLEDEADEANKTSIWRWVDRPELIWTSPILTQGKLGALRGSFSGDAFDTSIHIDGIPVQPLISTPDAIYFMPPSGLSAGGHNYLIDTPGMPRTMLPIFYMILTMWADQLDLNKGQSTIYHVKLDGLNGFPASSWGSFFIPTDLVSPSELQAGKPDAPSPSSSRSGMITLTVTNQSPDTIAMQNEFVALDAKSFAPSGTYQLNGGVGAILDGGFNILGVARAYLQPEIGLGTTPASPDSPSDLTAGTSWTPPGGWSFTPASTSDGPAGGNPHSTTVENPPGETQEKASQEKIDEARKRRNEATKRRWAAGEKAEKAKANKEKKQREEEKAWDDAVDHAPDNVREDYKKKVKHVREAADEAERTRNAYDRAHKQAAPPSPADEAKLGKSKYDAEQDYSDSSRSLERTRRYIISKFTKADHDAWDAARAAAEAADRAAAQADAELREAREAEAAAEKALRDLYPPEDPNAPPRIPIG